MQFAFSILENIGDTLRHALILEPQWADGGEVQLSINGFEGSFR